MILKVEIYVVVDVFLGINCIDLIFRKSIFGDRVGLLRGGGDF